jgi:hypothetical protein
VNSSRPEIRDLLRAAVAPFERPSLALGTYQIATSIGLYVATLAATYRSRGI